MRFDDKKLVLVERFEELRTGIRVVHNCTFGHEHFGIANDSGVGRVFDASGRIRTSKMFTVTGARCEGGLAPAVTPLAVIERRVRRFASDLGIDDELAREENPYLSRSVVGTGGRDEVRTPAKERTR